MLSFEVLVFNAEGAFLATATVRSTTFDPLCN